MASETSAENIASSDPVAALPSLAGAAWLAAPSTRGVLEALAVAGYEGRVVGGSVRNTLLGLPVTDIDIATPATPEAVIEACRSAGLATIPTGIEHGTVTVIADHRPVEVTTLRRDVETDGRRAVVAFTDDWREDASRRDFTINALYCDAAGRLHDPVGGYPDVLARRVRFIGDADARIREDYLRILRFFRFHATYACGQPDAAALAACARGHTGLARLSAERIRAELVKLLVAPGLPGAVAAMSDIGLLANVLGSAPRPGVLARVVDAERAAGAPPDAMLRLAALAVAVTDDVPRIAHRLRLSGAEEKALLVLDHRLAAKADTLDAAEARRIVYRKGAEPALRLSRALAAIRPDQPAAAQLLSKTASGWQPPRLLVSGADVLALGVRPGPAVGVLLAEVEGWWLAADFPSEERVRRELAERVSRLLGAG